MTTMSTNAQLENAKLELQVWKLGKERDLIEGSPIAHGEFVYVGPVLEDQVHDLIEKLNIWSRNHPKAPITLTINSQGGIVIDGFALYDFIQELKRRGHHITTKSMGLAASMGGILLQAGDTRVMTKRAWMLIHEVTGIVEGSFSDMKNVMKFNGRLQEQALSILAERSNWSRAKIKRMWKDDIWLDAPDSLKAGFVDKVEEG